MSDGPLNYADLGKIPWPAPGDTLFQEGQGERSDMCLNFCGKSWEAYCMGYERAARALVNQAVQTDRPQDTLFYPIAFLFRHYIELRLKTIITTGRCLLDQEGAPPFGHRFDQLWPVCRKVLEDIWPAAGKKDLDTVESCIGEFCRLDPKAESFRYPVCNNGSASLQNLSRVDINNLEQVMERISSFLETSMMGITAYLDDKDSFAADFTP